MSKLADIKGGQQLALDDVLAEFRDEAPLEGEKGGQHGSCFRTTLGIESHNGLCPYTTQCETRRRRLPTYRQYQPCHWIAWRNVGGCPIYRNGGIS